MFKLYKDHKEFFQFLGGVMFLNIIIFGSAIAMVLLLTKVILS